MHVSRGIFDRGAINNFIYEFNLEDESRSLSEQISRAFTNWKGKLAKTPSFPAGPRPHIVPSEFVEKNGVFWKRDGKNSEDMPYCPKCRLAMFVFPPRSNELAACASYGFKGPFQPMKIKEILSKLRQHPNAT
jgi:hypothetical protein